MIFVPTPSAMRKMLLICDDFASSIDVVFNAEKCKFLVVIPNSRPLGVFYAKICVSAVFSLEAIL